MARIVSDLTLKLTEEQIWRAQGGRRPEQVRPALRTLMQRALEAGQNLFQPRLAYAFYGLRELRHDRLILDNGVVLHSASRTPDLAGAERVAVAACTIGPALDERVRELLDSDMALAAALDGVGSAAVDALSSDVCRLVEAEAQAAGLLTTMPYSPGDGDWPLEDQEAVLSLLPANDLGITLSRDYLMTPLKSLTMVIGAGKQVTVGGVPCERCSAAARCRYRIH
jgi:hypothetical protein